MKQYIGSLAHYLTRSKSQITLLVIKHVCLNYHPARPMSQVTWVLMTTPTKRGAVSFLIKDKDVSLQ